MGDKMATNTRTARRTAPATAFRLRRKPRTAAGDVRRDEPPKSAGGPDTTRAVVTYMPPPVRIRGSRYPYEMSTSRFATTYPHATNKSDDCRAG